ncbi:MAG: DUF6526 family protein [Gemmatimonadales bacterium]
MPEPPVQSYQNHRRYLLPWHFIVMPLLGANAALQIKQAVEEPGFWPIWNAVVASAVVVAFMCARWMAKRVQDRVVRLEETLRLERLLPGRGFDIEKLTVDQLVGIRFASDGEVPHLVDRILAGELVSRDDVKKAVQHWRSDHLRV